MKLKIYAGKKLSYRKQTCTWTCNEKQENVLHNCFIYRLYGSGSRSKRIIPDHTLKKNILLQYVLFDHNFETAERKRFDSEG